jgi:release factor glutamine methyltransferase
LGLADLVREEVREDDYVLDMGTGSGINGIVAATIARHVVAVDLTADAVACARDNAARNEVAYKMDIFQSNIFDRVTGRFSFIVFDPPFRWFKPSDSHEIGMTDENYVGLRQFFLQVDGFLAPGGRVLMAFSTIGDLEYLRVLITESRLVSTEVRRFDDSVQGEHVSHFAYRLTRVNED